MTETITLAAETKRTILLTVDIAFEAMESAKPYLNHLAACHVAECTACGNARAVQKNVFRTINQELRNIVDLMTKEAVERLEEEAATRPPTNRDRAISTRRVAVETLNSSTALLEAMVQIDGDWKPLGDMTADDCGTFIIRCQRLQDAALQAEHAFSAMRDRLQRNGKRCVRNIYKEGELEALLGTTALGLLKRGSG